MVAKHNIGLKFGGEKTCRIMDDESGGGFSFLFSKLCELSFNNEANKGWDVYRRPRYTDRRREALMHLSMVCPRMGGPGNPRELDFVKRTWVGILTSTTVPGWEIWLDGHLEKWRGPGNEWVVRYLGKFQEVIWTSFPRPRMAERKVRSIVLNFLSKNVVFTPISALSLKD